MPNWCFNKLIVKSNGCESEFQKFIAQGRTTEIIDGKEENVWRISNYIPAPERLLEENLYENEKKELINLYGYDNWYDWSQFNWGTKWECDDQEFGSQVIDNDIFETSFYSAWTPPIEFLIKTSILYPMLSFNLDFIEPGCNYAGTTYINNGLFLDLCSETVHMNENKEIIEVEFNDDNEHFVLSTGEIYNEKEWYEMNISNIKNPFEDFKY